ncbi:hypothetical protein EVG20_g1702 [Dentipellis fragilis]|uniref:Uncharacterized protein n=1 Tax=Dentipellis fragilis TaxID=205917 RepID=A0A4Y9ZAX6_9AGAM|nr:hypothetical protein EVG20_g1702 [Dentipellis fragilis]
MTSSLSSGFSSTSVSLAQAPAETTATRPKTPMLAPRLDHIVTCLFTSDDDMVLARNKHDLFQSPEDMQDFIVPRFHPYFQCLSSLVVDWWNILQLAYRTYDAVTPAIIHQQVLDVLDDALQSLPDSGTEKEDNRRLADLKDLGFMSLMHWYGGTKWSLGHPEEEQLTGTT